METQVGKSPGLKKEKICVNVSWVIYNVMNIKGDGKEPGQGLATCS